MTDLPPGWAWSTLGEIAEVVGGVTKDSRKQSDPTYVEVPYLRVANVQRGFLDLSRITTIRVPPAKANQLELKDGDVLLNEGGDRDKVGRGWVWHDEIPGCIHQNHVFRARIHARVLDPRLLAWYGNEVAHGWFEANATQSVNLASISRSRIQQLPVPIPPVAEQRRIVAALEQETSRLDVAAKLVRSGSTKLGTLRQAELRSILSTTDSEPRELRSLLVEKLVNGRSVPTEAGGFPVLRLTALRYGRIDLHERKPGAWTKREAASYLVKKGDFFVSRGNGSLRLVAFGGLVDEEPDAVAFPDTLIRIRTDERQINPAYLALVWNSPTIRHQIEQSARTTAGIYKVNQQILERISVPLPSLDDQRRILRRINLIEADAGRVGDTVGAITIRADRLRSSLLRAAFAGRLVEQDPHDEPASELLARIKAERASATPTKKARPPRTPKPAPAHSPGVTDGTYQQEELPL